MSNRFVRVTIRPDGTLDLVDRRTGGRYHGLNRIRDHGDAGDLYVTRPAEGPVGAPDGRRGRVRLVEHLHDRAVYEARVVLPAVPTGLDPERKRRAGPRKPIALTFNFTLYAHDPAVHIRAA